MDMSLVEKESYEYYKNTLETGEHIGYLVYDNETFIGAGGVSFYQVMPTYHNPTGKKAYIMNIYIKVMSALFVAVIAVFAFIPSSKYKRRDSAEK